MQGIRTSIEIAAPSARVWEILTRFAEYPAWNPFVRSIGGDPVPGGRLRVTVQPEGGGAMTFSPRVLVFDPGRELRWKGRLLLPGLFDGEHYFQLFDEAGGVRFIHGEDFGGVLVPLVFRGAMRAATERGFEAMNQALKRRAESGQ